MPAARQSARWKRDWASRLALVELDGLGQGVDVSAGRTPAGEYGHTRFDLAARLQQGDDALRMQAGAGLAGVLARYPGGFDDDAARAAGQHLQHVVLHERGDGEAQRGAADLQPLGQCAFRGQRIAH